MAIRPKAVDSNDWFQLAAIHGRKGNPDEARRWYDKAVAGLDGLPPHRRTRFDHDRAEAATVLGIPVEAAPKPPPQGGNDS